ncbi:MAG: ATP-binding protein, partial [Acidobacteriota bacterium]
SRGESLLFFFMTLMSFIVYAYSPAGDVDLLYKVLYLIEDFARIILPPLTLHFFLRFPRPLVRSRWAIPAIYAFPALLALWEIDLLILGNVVPIASLATSSIIVERWQVLHFAIYFTVAFAALAYTYRTASVAGQRRQVQWIFFGMGLGFFPFLFFYLIPFVLKGSETGYTSLAILPLALIPLAFAVSILRYRLWDVEVIIKEVLAYAVTFIFGVVAFSTINLFLSRMIEEQYGMERNFLAFTSGLLIAGVLIPVKGRIESLIDMFVYRDTYRHRKAMIDFAQELASFRDLGELIDSVRERLAAAINLHQLNLYVREGSRFRILQYEQAIPSQITDGDFPVLPVNRPLTLDEPHLPHASEVPGRLIANGYRYLFPLRHRGELQGMLIVGNKRDQEALSRDDTHLIGSITASVALAIENARLYGRLRQQLDEIRSLKEYNEHVIESSSSAIVVVAGDGTVLTANRAFWELVGVGPDSQERIAQLLPAYAELDLPLGMTAEIHSVNRAGQEKYLTVSANAFSAMDAPPGTIVLVLGDVSERVRLERELQDKDRLASLGLLAAGVAHEVNTPLAGISSYAQLILADTPQDDPRYAMLKKMEQQTFRASHLVNNLLNFARNRSSSNEKVDLDDLIRSTVSLHESLFEARHITVHLDIADPVTVHGDHYQLQQVLTNLLLNAKDAVSEGGLISVTLLKEGGWAKIIVSDDGPGIPTEMGRKVFQPLVTTKQAQGGTGLGLAISERIVRSHGGEINLESGGGPGATFSVSLPLSTGN